LPAKFPLTDDQYRDVMGNEDSLSEALAEHRLYLLDYAELDDLTAVAGASSTGQSKYVYAPIALFAIAKGQSSLTPVAIQCGQNPTVYPLFFKVDKSQSQQWWGWQMAKTIVQIAEANYHELFVHLARTHLVLEAFTVATHRYLADCHPLNVLLLPHFEGTLFINNAAAKQLIAEGGPIDHIFGAPIARTQQAAGTDRLNFDFYANMLPTELKNRQVANPAWLPDYPYRDDALLVWSAIEQWVNDYVAVYYNNDAAVMGDTELAAWTASLISEGKIKGFKEITGCKQLVSVLTMIIYTASAQHAAVNFPQKPLMTYAPALSGAGWQAAPGQQGEHSEQDWLQLLPPIDLSFEQLNVLYLLGSVHYRRLGDYRSNSFPYLPWFEDDKITKNNGPLAKFQQSLVTVESTINARNSERINYEFLLPSQIPNSINI
jgi:arachidonate 15-lipoxygenase